MITLQLCRYPSATYIVGPSFAHGQSMPRISDLLARVSDAAFALTRQSLEVPRKVEVRAQERNVTD
jgi:hypothetical protein